MIQEIELLTPEECSRVFAGVHELSSMWIHRETLFPFYTLGGASYLDAVAKSDVRYYARAKQINPCLWEHFEWIYEKVLENLSTALGAPARYAERFALPGFHIFKGHQVFRQEFASCHFDLQYELLNWAKEIENWTPISFTLPIVLPSQGAGLWHWELFHEEVAGLSQIEKQKLISSRERSCYAYKEGMMLVHSGHRLHQIAGLRDFQSDEERITLQGHGLLIDGIWQLYW